MKKTILLALAAVSVAMFALPALVSAGTWHVDEDAVGPLEGSGGAMELATTSGEKISCTSHTVAGEYETTTGGWLTFTFHGCKGPMSVTCTTEGQSSGTITMTTLPFQDVILDTTNVLGKTTPGILVTPSMVDNYPSAGEGLFTMFTCTDHYTRVVRGNGVIGAVISPTCGETTGVMTLVFSQASQGHQGWTRVTKTGTTYDLTANVGGTAFSTTSMSGAGVVTLGDTSTLDCTHPLS